MHERSIIEYTNATATLSAVPGAAKLVWKSPGAATEEAPVVDGTVTFATGTAPRRCVCHWVDAANRVLGEFTLEIRQDLAHAPADYDPRSINVITLEALEAKIAGRALTIQQSKVSVGDRSIEYMNSIEELLKWRDHYALLVAKEQGHAAPTAQVCRLRRV